MILFSSVSLDSGACNEGPHITTIEKRTEYSEVRPTVNNDKRTITELYELNMADSRIRSFE